MANYSEDFVLSFSSTYYVHSGHNLFSFRTESSLDKKKKEKGQVGKTKSTAVGIQIDEIRTVSRRLTT